MNANGFVRFPQVSGTKRILTCYLQRIDRIRSTLSSDLDHLFSNTLKSLTRGKDHKPSTESEKVKLIADISECLKTYDSLGLWRDAEEVLRRDVVHDFVKKVRTIPIYYI